MVNDILEAYGIKEGSEQTVAKLSAALLDLNKRSKQLQIDQADLGVRKALGVDALAVANEEIRVTKEAADIISKELSDVAIDNTERQLELQIKLAKAHEREVKQYKQKQNYLQQEQHNQEWEQEPKLQS